MNKVNSLREMNVFIGSDTHCGHDVGLTPKSFNWEPPERAPHSEHKNHAFRVAAWDWFEAELKKCGAFDVALWVGDLVDGPGEKTSGTEDQEIPTQVDMATEVIKVVHAKRNYFVRGTPYHGGPTKTTWEDMVCAAANGNEIGDEGHYCFNGLNITTKHKIGNSSSPVSRFTALSSAMIKQMLWAESKQQPLANLIVRAHIHRCSAVTDPALNKQGWVTPALQGLGSVYGGRQTDGLPVHFGFLTLRVKSLDDWGVIAHIAPMEMQAAHVVVIDKTA